MGPQAGCTDVLLVATLAHIGPVVRVQSLVQLQMHKLCELLRAEITGIWFLTTVQPQMGLQVGGARETLLADVALMRFLARMHQMMLLEVRQLGEALRAHIALEGPFAGMGSQVDLEVAQLAKSLAAHIALVVHLAILLLERIGQRSVASGGQGIGTQGAAAARTRVAIRTEAAGWGYPQRGQTLQGCEGLHQRMVQHLSAGLQ